MGVHRQHTSHIFQNLNKRHYFLQLPFICGCLSVIPKLSGTENISTKEVIDKLDIFQFKFVKVDEFVWWDLERIQTYNGIQFTSKEFHEGLSICVFLLTLAEMDN